MRCVDCDAVARADGTGRPIVLKHEPGCPKQPQPILAAEERAHLTEGEIVAGSFALSKLACIAMADEIDQVLVATRVKLVGIRQRYTEMMTPGTKAHQAMVEALYRAGQERRAGSDA